MPMPKQRNSLEYNSDGSYFYLKGYNNNCYREYLKDFKTNQLLFGAHRLLHLIEICTIIKTLSQHYIYY